MAARFIHQPHPAEPRHTALQLLPPTPGYTRSRHSRNTRQNLIYSCVRLPRGIYRTFCQTFSPPRVHTATKPWCQANNARTTRVRVVRGLVMVVVVEVDGGQRLAAHFPDAPVCKACFAFCKPCSQVCANKQQGVGGGAKGLVYCCAVASSLFLLYELFPRCLPSSTSYPSPPRSLATPSLLFNCYLGKRSRVLFAPLATS